MGFSAPHCRNGSCRYVGALCQLCASPLVHAVPSGRCKYHFGNGVHSGEIIVLLRIPLWNWSGTYRGAVHCTNKNRSLQDLYKLTLTTAARRKFLTKKTWYISLQKVKRKLFKSKNSILGIKPEKYSTGISTFQGKRQCGSAVELQRNIFILALQNCYKKIQVLLKIHAANFLLHNNYRDSLWITWNPVNYYKSQTLISTFTGLLYTYFPVNSCNFL